MKRPINVGSTNHIADMKWVVTGLMLIFLSCNGQKKSAMETEEMENEHDDNRLSLIISDHYTGSDEAETLFIRDEKSLQKFYSKINKTRKPGLPSPEIDFSKEMVIVRCAGKQEDSSVPELYLMEDTGVSLVIGIKKMDAKATSSAITSPFSVYKMPLTEKQVIIRENQ